MQADHLPPNAAEAADDCRTNPSLHTTIGELIDRRISRRQALQAGSAAAAGAALAPLAATEAHAADAKREAANPSSLSFPEVPHGLDERPHVAEGYEMQVLLRWGDPIVPEAPEFDPQAQSATAQLGQFGYNNDFIAFMPLPQGSKNSDHGLLCVNHEYTNAWLMFPGLTARSTPTAVTQEQVDITLAAHGHSVVEIKRQGSAWKVVRDGRYNRRISALATACRLSGPAAGSDLVKTSADPAGQTAVGILNNCAGGVTPWGTVLIAEENFNNYFGGDLAGNPNAEAHARYGVGEVDYYGWSRFYDRFDVSKEPNEANRFGWMVEYDPYDPESVPVKRTALGRFKHEGATPVLCPDGRVAVYSGDDQMGEYLYKFVSRDRYDPANRQANRDLLDYGTLYVAKFHDDGRLSWLPMQHGTGPLVPANGFPSQAEVLVNARQAADALGATPLDRPEDVEVSPVTGRVYVMLTNNVERGTEAGDPTNASNPRPKNIHGHVLELMPTGEDGRRDHAAGDGQWEIFLLAGNPADPESGAMYHPATSPNGWLSCPDNAAFDSKGRLWIATDGADKTSGFADGIYGTDATGDGRALTRLFFRGPVGSELCGPYFTPDDSTLFVAVQHPAEDSGSTYDQPSTRWPDFKAALPPRPSVVAITRKGGRQEIGG